MGINWLPWSTQQVQSPVEGAGIQGYVIYRTKCIPQSITRLSGVTKSLNSEFKLQSFSDFGLAHNDEPPQHVGLGATQGPVIMADPLHFDQGSIQSIYDHFMSCAASQKELESTDICWECVLYDEISQQAFSCAPLPDTEEKFGAGTKSLYILQHMRRFTLRSNSDSTDSYDSFMGGEILDEQEIEYIPPKKGMAASSDSEDEYDGFLGGYM